MGYPPGYGGYPPGYGPGYYPPLGPPPSNHLVWAILTMLFCCQVTGVVSLVFAAQVDSKWQRGDYDGAYDASRKAKGWAIAGPAALGAVVVAYILIAALVFVLAGEPA